MRRRSNVMANQIHFSCVNSLGKGEVVSSILTGSTTKSQDLSRLSVLSGAMSELEPVMNRHETNHVRPPSGSNKTSDIITRP